MEVKKITHGPVDLRRILPGSWKHTYKEFLLEGINLKNVKWRKEDDLRILLTDLEIKVHLNLGGVFVYKFKRGWQTDLASVPWFFRTQVDNDDRNIILAALVHDANFAAHFLTFDNSNDIFRQMIRVSGGSWWFACKAYWGVQNPFGRMAYRRTEKEIKQQKEFLSFEWRPR